MANIPDNFREQFRLHFQKTISLSEEDFEKIVNFFTIKTISRNEFLLRPLQVCKYDNYVIEGMFQTAITDETGRLHTLYFPHEDWWVGDLKSFKTETGSSLEILALEDSVLLQISKLNLEVLYKEVPILERFFRIMNEKSGIALQDRIVQNYSVNAEKKYEEFKTKYPAILNRLSNKSIASFLGVTPEYFSQKLNKKKRT